MSPPEPDAASDPTRASARAILESLPTSPGMAALVPPGPIGEALAAELGSRGLAPARAGEAVDVAFVVDEQPAGALEEALARCRDRGLVVYVGEGPVERIDLYPEVHKNGLRLTFRSLAGAAHGSDRA